MEATPAPLSHTQKLPDVHAWASGAAIHVCLKLCVCLDAGIVLLVNAAFVACCLRTICLRIFWPNSQQSAPPAASAAADVPQAAVARGGAAPDASHGAAHISMTAVIQPNDEVNASADNLLPGGIVQKPPRLLAVSDCHLTSHQRLRLSIGHVHHSQT